MNHAVHSRRLLRTVAIAATESVVQTNGVGPFGVNYINPKDDPRMP